MTARKLHNLNDDPAAVAGWRAMSGAGRGRYAPQYPALFRAPGERCPKMRHRDYGRVPLQCVRRVHGPDVHHLMDVRDVDAKDGSRPDSD